MDLAKLKAMFFTFEGRLNRWAYFKSCIILFLLNVAINLLAVAIFGSNTAKGSVLGNMLVGVWQFASWCAGITLMTRRLHDLNKSGWLQLIFIVPTFIALAAFITMVIGIGLGNASIGIVGGGLIVVAGLLAIAFQLWVLFKKGTEGPNDYGSDPLAPLD